MRCLNFVLGGDSGMKYVDVRLKLTEHASVGGRRANQFIGDTTGVSRCIMRYAKQSGSGIDNHNVVYAHTHTCHALYSHLSGSIQHQ
jgi:hypothetical protein